MTKLTEILERQLPVAGALLALALIICAIGLWP